MLFSLSGFNYACCPVSPEAGLFFKNHKGAEPQRKLPDFKMTISSFVPL